MSLEESLCLDEQKGPETPQVCAAGQGQMGRQAVRPSARRAAEAKARLPGAQNPLPTGPDATPCWQTQSDARRVERSRNPGIELPPEASLGTTGFSCVESRGPEAPHRRTVCDKEVPS